MPDKLHIVSLDVPFPLDYGGVIDIFYKIKYLHQAGVSITLHCFEYGRGEQPELEKYCEAVYYYPRRKGINLSLPYIVSSRQNKLLRKRLMDADGTLFLEGIHCTFYLQNGDLKNKNVWVRIHNVEYEYYHKLYLSAKQPFRKIYYYLEARLLKRYESKLAVGNALLAVSRADADVYRSLGAENIQVMPLFLGSTEVSSVSGKGNYCLYHGNLSVDENEAAVTYLIKDVFAGMEISLKVAGKNPSSRLAKLCSDYNIQLIANPGDEQLREIIRNAHIHVLPSLNNTGVKLKLIHALLQGRFIVTNESAVQKENWASECSIVKTLEEFKQTIGKLMAQSFTDQMIIQREKIMKENFDSERNAQWLIRRLFN